VRRLRQRPDARMGLRIDVDVVLGELASLPPQPVAHLAGIGTPSGPVELELRHGRTPPAPREGCDKSMPGLPVCAECNPSGPPAENPPGRGAGLLRRRSRGEPR